MNTTQRDLYAERASKLTEKELCTETYIMTSYMIDVVVKKKEFEEYKTNAGRVAGALWLFMLSIAFKMGMK